MSDHALVIGIDAYPGLKSLKGPGNDARRFVDWLARTDGGGLADANISRIYPPVPAPSELADARPVLADIENLLWPFVQQAVEKKHNDGRLFMFMAGHGFADPNDGDSAAFFTANAAFFYPLHFAFLDYAEFFRLHYVFDEIIVVMDACRSTSPLQEVTRAPLPKFSPHEKAGDVRRFIGFATGHNQLARERPVNGNGDVHGIFTLAFLDALENAQPNRLGHVNGSAVKRHVHNCIDRFAGDVAITPPDIHVDNRKEVLFVKRAATGIAVKFQAPQWLGKTLLILFGGVEEVYRETIQTPEFSINLATGLYKVIIEATPVNRNFEVPADVQITL